MISAIASQALSQAFNCDVTHYVFEDQYGAEAVVKEVADCFNLRPTDRPYDHKKDRAACMTFDDALKTLSTLPKSRKLALFGARAFTVSYNNPEIIMQSARFFEVIGFRDFQYRQFADPYIFDLKKLAQNKHFRNLTGNPPYFDFYMETSHPEDTPYRRHFGLKFKFKRCSSS